MTAAHPIHASPPADPPSGKNPTADTFRLLAATAFGSGLAPVASGTFGTIVAAALHAGVSLALPPAEGRIVLVALFAAACAAHIPLVPWAERRWGPDPSPFVLDEVAGYLLVAVLVPSGPLAPRILWGFLAFRFFDILKPPPARQFDSQLPGPAGVLLDDLAAALYAVLVLYILRSFGATVHFPRTMIP